MYNHNKTLPRDSAGHPVMTGRQLTLHATVKPGLYASPKSHVSTGMTSFIAHDQLHAWSELEFALGHG